MSVQSGLAWRPLLFGLGVGFLVAVLFAAFPLLEIRRISPLLIFRRPFEGRAEPRWDGVRALALLVAVLVVIGGASIESHSLVRGLWFSGGIIVVLGILGVAARVLISGLRSVTLTRLPYVLRQGLMNLNRPSNQTVLVVLVIGVGAFLLDTLFLVQHNLLRDLRLDGGRGRPNLALFDIQKDQRAAVSQRLLAAGLTEFGPVPIVPMRIQSLRGVPASATLETSVTSPRANTHAWALRREYRSTYRDELTSTERTAAGEFWTRGAAPAPHDVVPISLEKGLAKELGIGLSDEIVWDVQGLEVKTRVVHLRDLSWGRFEPNFFVVFPKGPLDEAPQTFVSLTRVPDVATRAGVERSLVEAFPNVSILDLAQVQGAIEDLVSRAAAVVRFMAVFSLITGGVVMVGAILTSRYDRIRQVLLLRTLGATRRQILLVAVTEYLTLGVLGGVLGLVLALGAGFGLVHFLFDSRFALPLLPLLGLAVSLLLGCVAAGLLSSLGFLLRPPLEALRTE